MSYLRSIMNKVEPSRKATQVEQYDGTGILIELAPELLCMIASKIDSAKDLGAFRLATKTTAAAGKFEVEQRLRRTKQIATRTPYTTRNEYGRISTDLQLRDLMHFFPRRCIENITFVNINARGNNLPIDYALRNVTFPGLQKLQIQHAWCWEVSSIQSMLSRHATTLRKLKLLHCTIVVTDDNDLLQNQVWQQQCRQVWLSLIDQLCDQSFEQFKFLEFLALDVQPTSARAGCPDCHRLRARTTGLSTQTQGQTITNDWPRQTIFHRQHDGTVEFEKARGIDPGIWQNCDKCKKEAESENALMV